MGGGEKRQVPRLSASSRNKAATGRNAPIQVWLPKNVEHRVIRQRLA